MASSDSNENIDVIFELFPVFNDGILQEVDVPVFLDQVAKTLRVLNAISAKLDDLYCYADGQFIADPNYAVENSINREFIQILINDKSFLLSVELSVLQPHKLSEVMESMSNDQNRFTICWQFDTETLDLLCDFTHDQIQRPISAISFSFGNMINGNRFVTHLNDIGPTFDSENVTSNCNIISDLLVDTNGKFNILFKINYYDAVNSSYDHKNCKLQFDSSSVTEIVTSLNKSIEFYFQLDFPPKLYLDQEEEQDSSEDSTSRWTDSDLISRETIGRCNTFMVKFQFPDSSDLPPLLSIMYSDFFQKTHPIIVTPISKYCIDYSDGLFQNNFPFEVKYGLECISSLSNAFKDDLYINSTKDAFYNHIQSKLDDGQENLLIEVLYQLFQEYVDGEVQNAYTNFVALFDELEGNNHERINRTQHLMKKIVLTPMRTIYLPPTPTRTKFMKENVNSNTMIMVYFRDDDKSYTSCDSFITSRENSETDFTQFLADPQFRHYFLEEIVRKRIFKENGFISAQPLKYLGTTASKIFSYGVLVQANSTSD